MSQFFAPCIRCGSATHPVSECLIEQDEIVCFVCWRFGHSAVCCRWTVTCDQCGKKGHSGSSCTRRKCKVCSKVGHEDWECTKTKTRCERCDRPGHLTPQCPTVHQKSGKPKQANPPSSAKRHKGRKKKLCAQCGGKRHTKRRPCPQFQCPKCGGKGHKDSGCPYGGNFGQRVPGPNTEQKARKPPAPISRCILCGSHEHGSSSCFIFQTMADVSDQSSFTTVHGKGSQTQKPNERPQAGQFKHDKPEQLLKLAKEALQEEKYDDAVALLNKLIVLAPEEAAHYVTRARAHSELHEFAAALRDFQIASTKPTYVPSAEIHLGIARCRLVQGSPSAALLALRDALFLDDSNVDALNLKRRVMELQSHMDAYKEAMARKRWRMARDEYGSILSVYAEQDTDAPEYVQCWNVELLLVECKWDEVTKFVDIILRNAPFNVEALTLNALVLFLNADLAAALAQVGKVLKLDPDNQKAKALRNRAKEIAQEVENGEKALKQYDCETAVESWNKALLVAGQREEEGGGGILRAVLLLDRAIAFCKWSKFNKGLKDVEESLKLYPTSSKAYLCRARIKIGLELFESAAQDFRASLDNGDTTLSAEERREIQAELKDTERQAKDNEQDLYATLGLSRSCTLAEIKKAYRRLSLIHHPDKSGVEEKFKQIANAHDILSNDEKRQEYDATLRGSYSPSASWSGYYEEDYSYGGW